MAPIEGFPDRIEETWRADAGWQRADEAEAKLAAAYESLREMIDLNETTGDPDPVITNRARALLPENACGEPAGEPLAPPPH